MMVRFTVKFKEWLIAVPLATIATAVASFVLASREGFSDAVYVIVCFQIMMILFDGILTLQSFNLPTGISAFAVVFIFLIIMIRSVDNNVQYVCLVCQDAALVVINIVLILHLAIWRISMENEGFMYRPLFGHKRYYKYSEITKIEFFKSGYIIVVGNKRIRCFSHIRNSDALYEQIVKPNLPMSKIKF